MTTTTLSNFGKLYRGNIAAGSIVLPSPQVVSPSGDGFLPTPLDGGNQGPNAVILAFYGAGANNSTATAQVTAWRRVGRAGLWIPFSLLRLNLTFGTTVGVVASDVLDTERFADTIAVATAGTSAYEVLSPADNSVGCVKLDCFGSRILQVLLAKGTCTSVNCLAATF